MKKVAGFVVVALLLGLGVLQAPPASAATCNGSEITGTGSIVVPNGVTCTLSDTTVDGSIFVQPGGTLNLTRVIVRGTVSASQPRDINITDSYMRGLTISGTEGFDTTFTICGTVIDGNVGISNVSNPVDFGNSQTCFSQGGGNRVCGPLQIRFVTGDLRVDGNTVRGAGGFNYDTKLTIVNNHLGGGLSTAASTVLANSGNVSNDAEARSITCPEGVPSPPYED